MKKIYLVIILMITVFAFSGCYTKISSGKADIEKGQFTSAVEKETFKPLNSKTTFSRNDPVIYYVTMINFLPKDTEITYEWYVEDKLLLDGSIYIEEDVKDQYFCADLKKGASSLPAGKYKVVLTGTNNDKQIFKITDTCTVK